LECEYGGEEDGIFIEDALIYNSQIVSIEEIEVHGTVELWTDRMILRRYRQEDALPLYQYMGTDPSMYEYSGWNPYATLEMAQATVSGFIEGYKDEHSYSWVMDIDDVIVGTIGAYDEKDGRIEVGFSVVKGWQGRGLATGALKKVLEYLTENEGIPCVTAWCAAENIGSQKVLEKAGMKLVRTEKDGLEVGDRVYDKLTYAYRVETE
jgi:RimJ/RimL family protein N-acetyltransferase